MYSNRIWNIQYKWIETLKSKKLGEFILYATYKLIQCRAMYVYINI